MWPASSPGREERMKDRRQSYSHPALQLPVFRTSQANEFSYTRNLSRSKELKLDGERPVLGREKFARLGTGENNTILKKGREHTKIEMMAIFTSVPQFAVPSLSVRRRAPHMSSDGRFRPRLRSSYAICAFAIVALHGQLIAY